MFISQKLKQTNTGKMYMKIVALHGGSQERGVEESNQSGAREGVLCKGCCRGGVVNFCV